VATESESSTAFSKLEEILSGWGAERTLAHLWSQRTTGMGQRWRSPECSESWSVPFNDQQFTLSFHLWLSEEPEQAMWEVLGRRTEPRSTRDRTNQLITWRWERGAVGNRRWRPRNLLASISSRCSELGLNCDEKSVGLPGGDSPVLLPWLLIVLSVVEDEKFQPQHRRPPPTAIDTSELLKRFRHDPIPWFGAPPPVGGDDGGGSGWTHPLAREAVGAASAAHEKKAGQGFASTAEFRTAVEMHAMKVATGYFEAKGYEVEETSKNRPYDLVATKGDKTVYVEVKGTTTSGEKVFLTKNEVAHAQEHPGQCVLFVVHGIEVESDEEGQVVASGGVYRIIEDWVPEDEDLVALAFQYRVPGEG